MWMRMDEILGKMEAEEQIEFMRFVACAIGVPKKERDAVERAGKAGAKIMAALKDHKPIDGDDVKEYNSVLKDAFPDEYEEGDKESSQDDKPDD